VSENDQPEKDLVSSIDPSPDEHVIDDTTGVPVLPLRDVVVYPHMVIPLFVGRKMSIVALDNAMQAGKRILLVAQKTADLDDPQPSDLYEVGTLATILKYWSKVASGHWLIASMSRIISRPKSHC